MTSLFFTTREETANVFPIFEQRPVATIPSREIEPRGSARLGEGKEPINGDSSAV